MYLYIYIYILDRHQYTHTHTNTHTHTHTHTHTKRAKPRELHNCINIEMLKNALAGMVGVHPLVPRLTLGSPQSGCLILVDSLHCSFDWCLVKCRSQRLNKICLIFLILKL